MSEILNLLREKYIRSINPINPSNLASPKNTSVSSPLRINLSAGWNDTPPYCHEVSGFTLNAPILLNDDFPIKVSIKKSKTIILRNIDNNSSVSITNMQQLLNCQSPSVPFALHKASILATGLIPFNKIYNLQNFINSVGGFELATSAKNIPVGSGLGTSSILIYSCIKAIYKFYNLICSEKELFKMTAIAEQILTTGGGYQDQIGAYSPNFKYISFTPGVFPLIDIENILLSNHLKEKLQSRLAFIYTGNTRIAKNLLQKIMEDYLSHNSLTLNVLKEIGNTSTNMKYDLINEDLESFASNMTKSFKLNEKLNSNFSNSRIDNIIYILQDLICGYMLSGAGNGGFLTVLLKEDISSDVLSKKLNNFFSSTNIKSFNFKIWF